MTSPEKSKLSPTCERALGAFREQYGRAPEGLAMAPGRVNLIGGYTDNNAGFVLPMTIDREVAIAFAPTENGDASAYSADYSERVQFTVDKPERIEGDHWANYVMGVGSAMRRAGHKVTGVDVAIAGDIPQGAGLSSSGALEVAMIVALDRASASGFDALTHVRLAQRAENEFVGVDCGIMDQFISRLGEISQCLCIDCRDLQYRRVPLDTSQVKVVVCDTMSRRRLSESEYNSRAAACRSAASKLVGNTSAILRDVPLTHLLSSEKELSVEEFNRALHVIRENERVGLCCAALTKGRYAESGRLMSDSHRSLRDLFEVSSKELDTMCEIADGVEGVYGTRMTGGGFGGCTVSLVRNGAEGRLIDTVRREYEMRVGKAPDTYVFEPSHGAHLLDAECCESGEL